MAHKKGVGSTDNGRDSKSKRLGVKMFGGEVAKAGNIIIRQRGTKYHPGNNVYMGKDFTIHAAVEGTVAFKRGLKDRVFVHVLPANGVAETIATAPKPKKEAAKPKAPAKEVVEVEEEKPLAAAPTVKEAPKAEKPKAEAPKADKPKAETPKTAPKAKAGGSKDDLKKVEGIGPKIMSLLNAAGIETFAQLAETEADKIREILLEAGSRYKMHDPTTWPQQAGLAAAGKWDELAELQDQLKGGRS